MKTVARFGHPPEAYFQGLLLSASTVVLRSLLLIYLLALVPLGLFNRAAGVEPTYDQVRFFEGPGASSQDGWSLIPALANDCFGCWLFP